MRHQGGSGPRNITPPYRPGWKYYASNYASYYASSPQFTSRPIPVTIRSEISPNFSKPSGTLESPESAQEILRLPTAQAVNCTPQIMRRIMPPRHSLLQADSGHNKAYLFVSISECRISPRFLRFLGKKSREKNVEGKCRIFDNLSWYISNFSEGASSVNLTLFSG